MKTATPRSSASGLELPRTSVSARRPVVTLWRPHIVLASSIELASAPKVTAATPATSPAAVRVQLATAATLAESVTDARRAFQGQAAVARARAAQATSDAERVSATMAAYRAEAALDDALTGTLREVTALLEQRGCR